MIKTEMSSKPANQKRRGGRMSDAPVVNVFFVHRGGRMSDAPVVNVEQGQLQGKVVNSPSGKAFYSFQGIPYAKPPLGSLRFKAPQPPESWDGIRDATSEGSVSAQIDFFNNKQYTGGENCLFLNVYTPKIEEASPKIEEDEVTANSGVVNCDRKPRLSNEIKMVSRSNGAPKDVIRANDPPEDDLPKNIGVNKFVNFFESLGAKK